MTNFIGTNAGDTIVPGFVSPGVVAIGPDTTPGDGDDLIVARGGDDIAAGGKGADTATLGAGDDIFGWAPADGSDRVFGQAGFDRLDFDGDDNAESFAISGSAGLTLLDRDVGDVTMRLDSVERIDLFTGAGADRVRIDDLARTGTEEVRIDLSGVKGSGAGDGASDLIEIFDGNGDSFVSVLGSAGALSIIGLPSFVRIDAADAQDSFVLRTGGGEDAVTVSADTTLRFTLDGGRGDDLVTVGGGDDLLLGGIGDDFLRGGRGDDTARLGSGDDIFVWVNGDGSDRVEGGAGRDALGFDGFEADETFKLLAAGDRALLERDLGDILMDLRGIENVTIRTFGGSDTVEIGDMSGTDIGSVEIAMSLPGRSGDNAADTVRLISGTGGETIAIASGGGSLVTVDGLPASVDVFGVAAIDSLTVAGGGGGDILRAQQLNPDQVQLTLDGGDGKDFLFGSRGDDTILGGEGDDRIAAGDGDDDVIGGRGDDIAVLGAGDDSFDWDPGEGNDAIDGGAGIDTLDFEAADVNEQISIAAEGAQAVLLRDVGAVRMEMDAVERIDLRVFGGTDEVTVRDLGDTDLTEVVIDLSGPDGAEDLVIVEGTEGADDVTISAEAGAIVVSGLSATIRIVGSEAGADQFVFRGFGGDDRIDAAALSGIELFVQGGAGDDLILGSAFGDTLSGDEGDDVILADGGNDSAFGGSGDDVLDGGAGFDTLTGGAGDDVLLNGEIIAQEGLLLV